jgi:ABC-type multidrug transport system ATPase subunit
VFWIDPRTTAYDQITPDAFFTSIKGLFARFDERLLTELIEGLALTEHINKAIYMLSAGSKRKVWLAAAFAAGATVTLLDEPFSALDRASIGYMLALLDKAAQYSEQAWVLADYEAPQGLKLAAVVDLGAD